MPIPSAISDLSTTPSLNSPAGSESPALVDDYLRTHAAFIKQVSDAGALKANDADVVKLTGNQTIAGTKTFSSAPVVPANSFPLSAVAQVATGVVLGRSTAGTGDVEALTTLPAVNGSALTNLNASNLASGTVPTARLGTGTADSTTFLRGDNTWQTINTSPTTSQVLNATAGASVGDVGTYAWLLQSTNTTTNITAGTTYAGSGLRYLGFYGNLDVTSYYPPNLGATPSGTWRAMGTVNAGTYNTLRSTLFLRIS